MTNTIVVTLIAALGLVASTAYASDESVEVMRDRRSHSEGSKARTAGERAPQAKEGFMVEKSSKLSRSLTERGSN